MIRRDLVEQIRQHGCIADAAACDLPFRQHLADAPVGQWMARISSVSSSIPMWILRHRRRFGPPTARQHMLACVRGVLTGIPFPFALSFDACAIHCPAVAACSNERGSEGAVALRSPCTEWQQTAFSDGDIGC